jgi:hypothetical protein
MWPGKKNAYDIELNITHRNGLVPGKKYSVKGDIILQFI